MWSGRTGRLLPVPTVFDGIRSESAAPARPHKGEALSALLTQSHCDRALYVGDDVSDEDVFRLRSPEVLSVRVERDPNSAADLFLRGQKDVARLVRELMRMIAVGGAVSPPETRRGADA